VASRKRTGLGVDAILGPRRDRAAAEQPAPPAPKVQRIRVTVYFDPEDIVTQDEVITEEFRRTHERIDRSELLRRAWRAYHAQLRRGQLAEPLPTPAARAGSAAAPASG
jgi:hypothetical protein